MFSPLKAFAMILFNQTCRGCSSAESYALLAVRRRGYAHRVAKACSDQGRHKHGPVYSATLVVKSAVAIVILHGLVILLWASFYRMRCFPSWELAFYFSATSYSTVGYGDLILPSNWRLLGPLEAITGVLMSGISVSVLFALVTPVARSRHTIFGDEFD